MTKEQMELEKGHLASQRLAMKGIREREKEGYNVWMSVARPVRPSRMLSCILNTFW